MSQSQRQGFTGKRAVYVYLHGLNSSPASFKARLLQERLNARGRGGDFLAPALPISPREAIATVEALLTDHDPARVTLIGSSLGGHYATWLAERHGSRAVLVNPAIRPHDLLAAHVGPQVNLHTGERWQLTPAHLEELRALEVAAITRPERYLLVVAMGDEVLDSRVALARFERAQQIVDLGGDHGFSGFARYVDTVLEFGG